MNKSTRTRKFIVESTAPVFNRKGYAGTSLSDLTQATGLTKGSIYGNFKNKEEVALAVFRHSVEILKQTFRSCIAGLTSPTEKLEVLLDYHIEVVLHFPIAGGCPMLNTAVEADDNFPALKELVAKEFDNIKGFYLDLFDDLDKTKKYDLPASPDLLAATLLASMEGAIAISRAQGNKTAMKNVVRYWKGEISRWGHNQ